jgi:hypothetical protein
MSEDRNPFDLDALRINPADPSLRPKRAGRKATKWRKQFVRVPWWWHERLCRARHISTYPLAVHLLYEHWRNGGRAVGLSNSAAEGVTRRMKWPALRELEQLGLITIERRPRKSPLVTVLTKRS